MSGESHLPRGTTKEAEACPLWGKWGDINTDVYYPLIAHMLDTSAIALTIWESSVSELIHERLSDATRLTHHDVGRWFAWLAGSHDVGKADPLFQGQLLTAGHGQNGFREFLQSTNLPLPPSKWLNSANSMKQTIRPNLRHEATGADAICRHGFPQSAAAVVAGHHGRYPWNPVKDPYLVVADHREFLASTTWASQHHYLLNTLTSAVCPPENANEIDISGEYIPLLTGLVSLADWLASDERFIRESPLELLADPKQYFEERLGNTTDHLSTRLGFPTRPTGTFSELFGFEPTRPVQEWAVAQTGPRGLTVIAVPMGEGKTETALWLHAAAGDSREGLAFALPTTATADAMFDRIRTFYRNTPSLAQLSHGRSVLNAFYDASDNRAVGVCDEEAGLSSSPWFAGPHRSLVAPVTVSTCDQVLAAGIGHKFVTVRLASLASKHVVLDEVHTYDPYQDRLLERTLTWLGAFGTRVTLLSATLPARRLRSYVAAYSQGAGIQSVANLPAEYPAITTATDAGVLQRNVPSSRCYTHELKPHTLDQSRRDSQTAALYSDIASDVGRTGLIVNTVDRAIQIAKDLRPKYPDLILLHSRMTANQRARATARLLKECGKDATAGPRHVVSTQIAEASLDIDFDVLISDLAPMTSLLQRMGRQWRHSQPTGTDGWNHPRGLAHRIGNPTLHLLVSLDAAHNPLESVRFPYSQAEIVKTWRATQALNNGDRRSIRIPDDVQAAVDAADVSFDDLDKADIDGLEEAVLLDRLAAEIQAVGMADAIGVRAEHLREAWQTDPEWESCEPLTRLTHGDLWRADAITRLRDSFSIDLLPYDPKGDNEFALHSTPEAVMRISDREQQKHVLGHVIPVSGNLAKLLSDASPIRQTEPWSRQEGVLLRGLVPVNLSDVNAMCQLTEFGLEKSGEGKPRE